MVAVATRAEPGPGGGFRISRSTVTPNQLWGDSSMSLCANSVMIFTGHRRLPSRAGGGQTGRPR